MLKTAWVFVYKPIDTNDVAPGWAKRHWESQRWPVSDILGTIFVKSVKGAYATGTTIVFIIDHY